MRSYDPTLPFSHYNINGIVFSLKPQISKLTHYLHAQRFREQCSFNLQITDIISRYLTSIIFLFITSLQHNLKEKILKN